MRRSSRLPLLAVLVFVLLLIAFVPKQDAPNAAPPDTQPPVATAEGPVDTVIDNDGGGVARSDLVGLLLLGALAAGVMLYTARHRTPANSPEFDSEELASDLAPAIDRAAEWLQLGGDPREAVIAAYASLERALAEQGRPRRRAETPSEHTARALAALPIVVDPVIRLGALYEIARFSDHPIGEADRRRAAAALDEARKSLEVMADHER